MQENLKKVPSDVQGRRIPRTKLIPSSNLDDTLSKCNEIPDSRVICHHDCVSMMLLYSLIDKEFITSLNNIRAHIKSHSGTEIKKLIFNCTNACRSFKPPDATCSNVLNKLFGCKYQTTFSNLSDLTVIIESKQEEIDDFIPIVQVIGKNLSKLRAFTFDFSPCEMSNQMFKKLGYSIGHYLSNLVSLHFKLVLSDFVDDEGIKYFLAQISRRLHKLKYFGLELEVFQEVTDKCAEIFGHFLSSDKLQLIGFKFGIWNCWKVSYDSLIKFLESIRKPLPHIRECALKFSNTTDKGLKFLGSYLAHYLTNLKILNLDFSDCEGITNTGLSTFGSQITGHLEDLQQLVLNFSISESRVDDDFRLIGYDILLGLPSLKILDLDFNTCPEISDDGLEIFGFVILPKLANLTHLRLSLSKVGGFRGITDEGFKLLAATIAARLTQLQKLTLELESCLEITDDGLQEAFPRLLGMPSLKNLKLYINDCSGISDKGFDVIESKIAGKSSNIEEITLRISGCNITPECKENIKRMLSSILTQNIS